MEQYQQATKSLRQGQLIAYPTEAVYGLGCDMDNELAVRRLTMLKKRDRHQGLILIAHDWSMLRPYVRTIPEDKLQQVLKTWPGHTTWIFPCASQVPTWIKGHFDSVAVRVTAHPVAATLCRAWGKPLVSTSANYKGESPALTAAEVNERFADNVDFILEGEIGNATKPSKIIDVMTNDVIRE